MLERLQDYLSQQNITPTDEMMDRFQRFSDLLREWNEKINLTAITEPDEIELKHFIDSLTILETKKVQGRVIDIGCGAGFPSFPLKIAHPDLEVTLLDSLNKRVLFQNEVIKELNLTNIHTVHSRGEDGGKNPDLREQFDIATARAVSSLPSLVELCIPFVKVGGYFIALKGSSVEEEIAASKKALKELSAEIETVLSFTLPHSEDKRNIIVIKKLAKTLPKYPRNAPKPIKQPL
ncbi:MAG: 16S rRNA (guanine(527)-N(7))-methyltransferase RsmG [Clostridia bacterium]|nr:16S rRNA (guanine(527)-N(7))-methyltransferase RsmG [Clostridia bacterium]